MAEIIPESRDVQMFSMFMFELRSLHFELWHDIDDNDMNEECRCEIQIIEML